MTIIIMTIIIMTIIIMIISMHLQNKTKKKKIYPEYHIYKKTNTYTQRLLYFVNSKRRNTKKHTQLK